MERKQMVYLAQGQAEALEDATEKATVDWEQFSACAIENDGSIHIISATSSVAYDSDVAQWGVVLTVLFTYEVECSKVALKEGE